MVKKCEDASKTLLDNQVPGDEETIFSRKSSKVLSPPSGGNRPWCKLIKLAEINNHYRLGHFKDSNDVDKSFTFLSSKLPTTHSALRT